MHSFRKHASASYGLFPALAIAILLWTSSQPGLRAGAPAEGEDRDVQVQMRNIFYHFTNRIAVAIPHLDGELVPTGAAVPVFDDKTSFRIAIDAAEIRISTTSMEHLLNDYVLAAGDAPLKDVSLTPSAGGITIRGKLHNKGDVPFEMVGSLTPTPDGKIRLHAEKVKALKLPVKGLLELLGVKIADLIRSGRARGLSAEKDDVILDPAELLPAPHISGKVTGVRVDGQWIVQEFGGDRSARPLFSGNYMAYRGHALRFGKLTMNDTDMILIDMDPRDPFDFSLDRYREQLSAGYTKITPQFGLRVYMRDLAKLSGGKAKRSR
jgi:hypothetical protein